MIKRLFIFLFCLCFCHLTQGQIDLRTEVHENELINLSAEFQELTARKDVLNAVERGALLSELYTLNKQYKDATSVCMQMYSLILFYETQTGKTNFFLRFLVTKERLRLCTQEVNYEKSKELLFLMDYYIRNIEDEYKYRDDILLVKGQFYDRFGMTDKSLEYYEQLLQHCLSGKTGLDREDCYKTMIAYAEQNQNAGLDRIVREKYTVWLDSVKMVQTVEELGLLKKEHETLQAELKGKEDSLDHKSAIIGSLCICILAIIACLAVLFLLYLRKMKRIRMLKDHLKTANDNRSQKSAFIRNINTQITPYLDEMARALNHSSSSFHIIKDKLAGLKKNIEDIQAYVALEEGCDVSYPVKDVNVNKFCENIMQKISPEIKKGVEGIVSAPRISIKTNTDALEQILVYLLRRSAKQTAYGKIILEFKKRNAHTGQFIITDTCNPKALPVPEDLFKPFGMPDPVMNGDRWKLPTCTLIARKLNGTLNINKENKKGAQFILDICF
ncbi:MAG: sensor histidine kinase [Tannerella sp.]|jgi:tetratricopeptide (TPR) repeat protein|nr:sensor histidine kinase [Tannerella sp.]